MARQRPRTPQCDGHAVALTRYDKITVEDLPDKVRNFRSPIGLSFPRHLFPTKRIDY